ncbi:hypothetical protein [Levilactobacillus brevis]|uniref:hypothetical protein n=1 Tax=Levilactobacillus brevis TaxID=1580 RepID=UPI003D166558
MKHGDKVYYHRHHGKKKATWLCRIIEVAPVEIEEKQDKSVLEKRIHDKAEERADRYFGEISNFLINHDELVEHLALTEQGKDKIYF